MGRATGLTQGFDPHPRVAGDPLKGAHYDDLRKVSIRTRA